jgi:hypothetical protein
MMATNSDLKIKIDQLYNWLKTNWNRLSDDNKNRGWDALITLQKQDLADQLSQASLPDITGAIKAMNTAIDGIKQEAQKLATVAQVVGWIAEAASLIEKAITSGIPF